MSDLLKLIRRNTVPPNGWRYQHLETGWWSRGGHFDDLVRNAVEYRRANHLPVGTNFEAEVEHQICEPLGADWCNNKRPKPSLLGTTFAQIVQATATLIDFALHGRVVVDNQEVIRRGTICATGGPNGQPCPMNVDDASCKPCNSEGLKAVVSRIVVNGEVPTDKLLKHCSVCGCTLRAKTRIPIEILHRHMSKKQNDDFPAYCWVKKPEVKEQAA